MSEKKTFYKLGPQATAFSDSKSKLNIANKQIVRYEGGKTPKILKALSAGHIALATETEFNAYVEAERIAPRETPIRQQNNNPVVDTEAVAGLQKENEVLRDQLAAQQDQINALTDKMNAGSGAAVVTNPLTKEELLEKLEELEDDIPSAELKGLAKKSLEDLQALYDKYKKA